MEKITIDYKNTNKDLFTQLFETKEMQNGFVKESANGFSIETENGIAVDPQCISIILNKIDFFAKRGYTPGMDSQARTKDTVALFNRISADFEAFENHLKNAGIKVRKFGE